MPVCRQHPHSPPILLQIENFLCYFELDIHPGPLATSVFVAKSSKDPSLPASWVLLDRGRGPGVLQECMVAVRPHFLLPSFFPACQQV